MKQFYDFPKSLRAGSEIVHSGGAQGQNLLTTSGIRLTSPEPGGRLYLDLNVIIANGPADARIASWMVSAIRNGRYFKIKISNPVQVVDASIAFAGVSQEIQDRGIPFSSGERFSSGYGFKFEPKFEAGFTALEGEQSIKIDTSAYPKSLDYGHLLGVDGQCHLIDDIDYDGNVASIMLATPLRADMKVDSTVSLRPEFKGMCTNPDSFFAVIEPGKIIRPGGVRFLEVW